MALIETERNLLFGFIAMQNDLIDARQYLDACLQWSLHKSSSLADITLENGWLLAQDREHVDYLLDRRLQKEGGSLQRAFAGIPSDLRAALLSLEDDEICEALHRSAKGDRFTTSEEISKTVHSDRITRHELYSSGGTGHVWKAHDQILDRAVALKELKAEQASVETIRQRFFREAQITAQLSHPGTVPIYDYVEDGGRSFYTMRFVQGRTFCQAIKEYHASRLEQETVGVSSQLLQLVNQFVSVCHTVAFAHSRNVIHRDLKSENVIVGDFGEVVVLDWGLAKRTDDNQPEPPMRPLTEPTCGPDSEPEDGATLDFPGDDSRSSSQTMLGDKLGTPAYMSPEQARGDLGIDSRSDVYGLAAILYEILTGEPPFVGKKVAKVLERVIHDSPKPPSECVEGVPAEIERICLQGLSKNRDDRQPSAAVLARQILSWIAGRAEQTFQDLLESAPDAMLVVDESGRISLVNKQLERLFGYTGQELIGESVEALIPQASRAAHKAMVAGFLKNPRVRPMGVGINLFGERKDGSLFPVDVSLSPIKTEKGLLLSCAVRDISERQMEMQRLEVILDSTPGSIVVVDEGWRIQLVNLQTERMFGFDRSELLGESIETLIPDRFREGHLEDFARFVSDPQGQTMARLRLPGRHKSGSEFPIEIRLRTVEQKEGLLICCAVHDCSDNRPSTEE